MKYVQKYKVLNLKEEILLLHCSNYFPFSVPYPHPSISP